MEFNRATFSGQYFGHNTSVVFHKEGQEWGVTIRRCKTIVDLQPHQIGAVKPCATHAAKLLKHYLPGGKLRPLDPPTAVTQPTAPTSYETTHKFRIVK